MIEEAFFEWSVILTFLERSVYAVNMKIYLFFESKEALYLDLFLQEVPAMTSCMIAASFGSTDDTREALVRMMKAIVHEM